jgi:hypothetical protein
VKFVCGNLGASEELYYRKGFGSGEGRRSGGLRSRIRIVELLRRVGLRPGRDLESRTLSCSSLTGFLTRF